MRSVRERVRSSAHDALRYKLSGLAANSHFATKEGRPLCQRTAVELPLVARRGGRDVPLSGPDRRPAARPASPTGGSAPGSGCRPAASLAASLGVSRTVVTAAYEQLYAEGWLEGRHGSGTFVAAGAPGQAGGRACQARPARRSRPMTVPAGPDLPAGRRQSPRGSSCAGDRAAARASRGPAASTRRPGAGPGGRRAPSRRLPGPTRAGCRNSAPPWPRTCGAAAACPAIRARSW